VDDRVESAAATGYRVVTSVFESLDGLAPDDQLLAVVAAAIAEGVAAQVAALGAPEAEARESRRRVLAFAEASFVKRRAERSAEAADAEEDAALFRRLLGQGGTR
jgi:hypothetical protein